MALMHLSRIPVADRNDDHVLVGDDGHEIVPYTRYRRHLDRKAVRHSTKERYSTSVARFIDYLIEFGAFGVPATADHIADVVEMYPLFLRDGARPRVASEAVPAAQRADYANRIGLPIGLAFNSMAPTLASINHFLMVVRDEAERAFGTIEEASLVATAEDLRRLFAAIDGYECWTWQQKRNFKQYSVMGAVVRFHPRLERPRGLRNPIKGGLQIDLKNKDFPIERLGDLLAQATSHRDRSYWALLAGGGLRPTEPLLIRMPDFNAATGDLRIFDPEMRRFGREAVPADLVRFKGRTMSEVFMWEPLRSVFWEALRDYLKHEFVATDENGYLFQRIDAAGRGTPFSTVSYTALEKAFKAAVVRAGIPGPPEAPDHVWTLQSLRHLYGVYMLNHIPVPGGPGLRLTEVQQLMGHADINSTRIYARTVLELLCARIAVADQVVFNGPDSARDALASFPKVIADRLRAVADRIEGAGCAEALRVLPMVSTTGRGHDQ